LPAPAECGILEASLKLARYGILEASAATTRAPNEHTSNIARERAILSDKREGIDSLKEAHKSSPTLEMAAAKGNGLFRPGLVGAAHEA
jgi:hypothetical protein